MAWLRSPWPPPEANTFALAAARRKTSIWLEGGTTDTRRVIVSVVLEQTFEIRREVPCDEILTRALNSLKPIKQ